MAGSKGAVLFCLHGCGYTGLTWSLVAAAVKDRCARRHQQCQAARVSTHKAVLLICAARVMGMVNAGRYRLVALDMRGHGESVTQNDSDLSSETLALVWCVTRSAAGTRDRALCKLLQCHECRNEADTGP